MAEVRCTASRDAAQSSRAARCETQSQAPQDEVGGCRRKRPVARMERRIRVRCTVAPTAGLHPGYGCTSRRKSANCRKFTAPYPLCRIFHHRIGRSRGRSRLFGKIRRGFGVGISESAGSSSITAKLPTSATSLQDHPGFCRHARHLGRQHGHRLSRLRARRRRRGQPTATACRKPIWRATSTAS